MFGRRIPLAPSLPEIDITGCQGCPAIDMCQGYAAVERIRDFNADLGAVFDSAPDPSKVSASFQAARFMLDRGAAFDAEIRELGAVVEGCPGAFEVVFVEEPDEHDTSATEPETYVVNPVFQEAHDPRGYRFGRIENLNTVPQRVPVELVQRAIGDRPYRVEVPSFGRDRVNRVHTDDSFDVPLEVSDTINDILRGEQFTNPKSLELLRLTTLNATGNKPTLTVNRNS